MNALILSSSPPHFHIHIRLQEKLLTEILDKHPEWWDEMRSKTRNLVQSKEGGGIMEITMDELAAKLIPTGKQAVPAEIKDAFITQYIHRSITDSCKR